MYFCEEANGHTLIWIAFFNVRYYSTMSETIVRLKKVMIGDKSLLEIINILSQNLTYNFNKTSLQK